MVSPKLERILLEELELDEFEFTESTSAPQVPGWDSLRHVSILTAVEEAYGIRFRPMEVIRLKTVGDLQALVEAKTRA